MSALSLDLWYKALAAQVGVIIKTDNPDLTKAKLYALRKAANDPDLDQISIRVSPESPDELWLVKGSRNA